MFTMIFCFQMPLISLNLRNLLLMTAVIGTLLLLFVALGPQAGISPASGMSIELEAGQSLKNLNLKASVLPVNFNGGDVAPGVSIKSENVNVLVRNYFWPKVVKYTPNRAIDQTIRVKKDDTLRQFNTGQLRENSQKKYHADHLFYSLFYHSMGKIV